MTDLEITMVVLAILFIAYFGMIHYIANKEIKKQMGKKLKKKLEQRINEIPNKLDIEIKQIELVLQKKRDDKRRTKN